MSARARFYDVRASALPEAIGRCATNLPELAAIVNEAQERLMMDPMAPDEGWWGSWARYAFTVTPPSENLITPREVARILSITTCKQPMRIRNQFFEFLEYGKGFQPTGCCTSLNQQFQAYERETVCTLSPFVGNKIVRAYASDPRDVGKRLLIQGKDQNGKVVYGTSSLTNQVVLGETVTFDTPFADSANTYSEVNGIQKDPTFGDITLFQVDPTTGVETALSSLEPNEQTAQYRKYFVNGINRTCCSSTSQQLLAMCRLDFIPVSSDSDYLLIQNVPALIEECMAVRYSRMDTPGAAQLAQARHAKALSLLFGQLDQKVGKERTAIRRSLFGSDKLCRQPV